MKARNLKPIEPSRDGTSILPLQRIHTPCNCLVAGANTLVGALSTRLSNVAAVILTAESSPGVGEAAADAALIQGGISSFQLLHGILLDAHVLQGFTQGLVGINHLVAALVVRVAGADVVAGAAVAGEAAAAVGVTLAHADVVAGGVAAHHAGDGVVAEGGGEGGARQEGSDDGGETHCVVCVV